MVAGGEAPQEAYVGDGTATNSGFLDGLATLSEAIDIAGEMAGLGKDPETVRPREQRVGLMDLLLGISESRLREWFGGFLPESASPRLLYQWMP